ncbi:MAG: DUF1549 domain-containing protein [bacterium]|nr:DUF1549 domain-containing protein [bacterium]
MAQSAADLRSPESHAEPESRAEPSHWAFVAPIRAAIPDVPDDGWSRDAIDRFVLTAMREHGFEPLPVADRATLIRRVSLDLTGLPPSPAAVEAFVNDTRPEAWGRLVDRLLASPQCAERLAVHWLDLARYADSNGYLEDSQRPGWGWRDWVIDAFDRNKPFDAFTVEQLAGDLLPTATIAQRTATAFLRQHAVAVEGVGQPGEYRHRYVADRVATTGAIWLGLTVGCAECHDHKHDPISQREYYGLYAFFDNVPERGLVGDAPVAPPFLRLPNAEQGAALLDHQAAIDRLHEELDRAVVASREAEQDWRRELARATNSSASVGPAAYFALDRETPQARLRGVGIADWVAGVRGKAVQLAGTDAFVDCGEIGDFGARDAFTVSAWVRREDKGAPTTGTIVGKVDEARQNRGYTFGLDDGRPFLELVSARAPRDGIYLMARDPLPNHRWHHVAASYDGSKRVAGFRLYVDGVPVALEPPNARARAELAGEIDRVAPLRIGCSDGDPFTGAIDEVRLYGTVLAPAEIAAIVRSDLAMTTAEGLVHEHFVRQVYPATASIARELADRRAARRELLEDVPAVSVMAENEERRPTHLLLRGDFTAPGEVVAPGVPAVLSAFASPDGARNAAPNRLALARWLVDPRHPLVGRVTVNRLWRLVFGRGLVRTPADFGTRGDPPTHPALLDFLAREFVDGSASQKAWDVKALIKRLVMTATYRQTSRMSAAALRRDPDNRWLARANALPLAAEFVRDNALAIGGLLDRRVRGPSIRPWQPAGVGVAASAREGFGYRPSPVADRNRRGLYVERRRSAPFASFVMFDASAREVCTVSQTRTNTPLQALVLWNDRVHLEAARGLARRTLVAAGDDLERLHFAFRCCVARSPEAAEIRTLRQLLQSQRAHYRADPKAAAALLLLGEERAEDGPDIAPDAPELAAWMVVANSLLSLHETITRT